MFKKNLLTSLLATSILCHPAVTPSEIVHQKETSFVQGVNKYAILISFLGAVLTQKSANQVVPVLGPLFVWYALYKLLRVSTNALLHKPTTHVITSTTSR